MAISQTKYISIASKIANNTIGNRDLSGIVFTSEDMITSATDSIKSDYDAGKVVSLSYGNVASLFGATKYDKDGNATTIVPVFEFATKYFSYIGADGKSPRTLYIAKVLDEETPSEAFTRVSKGNDNFGSFTFLNNKNEYSIESLKAVYDTNTDNKYLAVHCEVASKEEESDIYTFETVVDNVDSLGTISGLHVVTGADAYCAAIPMSILASINYDTGVNSVVNFMFRNVNGEIPVVTSDDSYNTLSEKNINFYGQTQANGRNISFYQRGFNLDGVDTGVYCNEMWLKSAIAESFLNFLTTVNRIPANYAGAGMVRNAIMGDVTQALSNGTIMIGKKLTNAQKAYVYQYTNDENAWEAVESEGFWLDVVIVADGNDYKAVYRLVYSKGDSIRFIDGTHYLV